MLNLFTDIPEALGDPATRHALFVHFPVVLSIIGVPFAVIAALLRGESHAMRWAALGIYLALTAAAVTARQTGQDAEAAIEGSVTEAAEEEIEDHERHGLNLWLWPAGISVLIGVSFVAKPAVRHPAAWLAVIVGLLAADQVGHTAHHGGRLVYHHGAGTQRDLAAMLAMPEGEAAVDPRLTHFREQVRPILVGICMRCHNPKRMKRAGGLDQTSIAGLLAGGWSGPAIVPGRADESLLIEAVRWTDEDLQMPPGDDQLAPEQIEALVRWIDAGAVWEPIEFTPPGGDDDDD